MTDTETRRIEDLREMLDEQFGKALDALAKRLDLDTTHDSGVYLQIVMEVCAYHLGYADAYASLGNIPRDVRERATKRAFREGQEHKVRDHNTECVEGRACGEVLRLLNEMYPN
jgi:hypothetical protein